MNLSFFSILSINPDFSILCIFSLFILFSGLSVGCAIKIFLPAKKSSGAPHALQAPQFPRTVSSTPAGHSHAAHDSKTAGHSRASHAFSATCIFLALAAILYTVLIFMSHDLFPLPEIQKNGELQGFPKSSYNAIFCIIFAWGILLAVFWKILIPLSAILYISFAIFTNSLLYRTFGNQRQNIPVKIEEDSSEIKVTVYTLPDILIVPAKRNWFFVDFDFHEKTSTLTAEPEVPDNPEVPAEPDALGNPNVPGKPGILSNPVANFYLNEFLLSRLPRQFVLPPPAEQAYPSLYSLRITFSKDFPKCELVREL